MNLTSRRLEAHGLYLIEDGQNMFLWLGKNAVPALVKDAFGLNSYDEVRAGKVRTVSTTIHVDFHLTLSLPDHLTSTGQLLLPTDQCHHRQDSRDAQICLLPASLRSEGGWRASIAHVGSQLLD